MVEYISKMLSGAFCSLEQEMHYTVAIRPLCYSEGVRIPQRFLA